MTVDNGVRIVAGCMLLLSLILTTWVHPAFVWLSAFVGVNLIQSAFTVSVRPPCSSSAWG